LLTGVTGDQKRKVKDDINIKALFWLGMGMHTTLEADTGVLLEHRISRTT
jgi:hypothetical protein